MQIFFTVSPFPFCRELIKCVWTIMNLVYMNRTIYKAHCIQSTCIQQPQNKLSICYSPFEVWSRQITLCLGQQDTKHHVVFNVSHPSTCILLTNEDLINDCFQSIIYWYSFFHIFVILNLNMMLLGRDNLSVSYIINLRLCLGQRDCGQKSQYFLIL